MPAVEFTLGGNQLVTPMKKLKSTPSVKHMRKGSGTQARLSALFATTVTVSVKISSPNSQVPLFEPKRPYTSHEFACMHVCVRCVCMVASMPLIDSCNE